MKTTLIHLFAAVYSARAVKRATEDQTGCHQFFLDISVTATNYILDIVRVDNNVEAVQFLLDIDRWTAPNATSRSHIPYSRHCQHHRQLLDRRESLLPSWRKRQEHPSDPESRSYIRLTVLCVLTEIFQRLISSLTQLSVAAGDGAIDPAQYSRMSKLPQTLATPFSATVDWALGYQKSQTHILLYNILSRSRSYVSLPRKLETAAYLPQRHLHPTPPLTRPSHSTSRHSIPSYMSAIVSAPRLQLLCCRSTVIFRLQPF